MAVINFDSESNNCLYLRARLFHVQPSHLKQNTVKLVPQSADMNIEQWFVKFIQHIRIRLMLQGFLWHYGSKEQERCYQPKWMRTCKTSLPEDGVLSRT